MKTTPATYSAEALAGTELPPAPPPSKKKLAFFKAVFLQERGRRTNPSKASNKPALRHKFAHEPKGRRMIPTADETSCEEYGGFEAKRRIREPFLVDFKQFTFRFLQK